MIIISGGRIVVCAGGGLRGIWRMHPEDLTIALENIERWLRLGRVHAGPLHEWRRRIEVARGSAGEWEAFLAFLAEPNHDSERIKSCSPFAGLSCLTETR
jgi:hypothetical protein